METRIAEVDEGLASTDEQVKHVLTGAIFDESVMEAVTAKLESMVESKNSVVLNLQFELERILAVHNGTYLKLYINPYFSHLHPKTKAPTPTRNIFIRLMFQ